MKEAIVFIKDNLSTIMIIIAFIYGVYLKVKATKASTPEEVFQAAVDSAKAALKKTLLAYVSKAEKEWEEVKKSGKIKESDVFRKIYSEFPVLAQVVDQDALIAEISDMIDEALVEMKKVQSTSEETTEVSE